MGLFSKKPKPDPFNPFAEGTNNFNPSNPAPTDAQIDTPLTPSPNTVSIEPPNPVVSPPAIDPDTQTELTQPVAPQPTNPIDPQPSTAPADNDITTTPDPTLTDIAVNPPMETVVPSPAESPAKLAEPVPPPTQSQDAPSQPVPTDQATAEEQTVPVETQPDLSALASDQTFAEPQALESPVADMAPQLPPDSPELTPSSPVDNLIADNPSGLEITNRPSNNFFRKNLVALIIISVVVIALSILSLVFYIKWQGEKADNLEKTGTINNLNSHLQSIQNDNTDDANLVSELDKLREEVSTLTNDKLKLEENNKTLTDQNTTLQTKNDELNKQVKTATCEAMTDTAEKKKCLDSIDTPPAPTE